MTTSDFVAKFVNETDPLTREEIRQAIPRTINLKHDENPELQWGHMDLVMCMEEFAELTQELSKFLRGHMSYAKGSSVWANLLQELADAQICIYYVQEICGIRDSELDEACSVKWKAVEEKYGDEVRRQ